MINTNTEEPLLPPGLHDLAVSQLNNHFFSDFPDSNTRAPLIRGLSSYIDSLKILGIPLEIWLDGSFTTTKIDPNDIDLVIFASENDVNNLSDEYKDLLRSLINRLDIKKRFGCDTLFSITEDINMRSYWRGWYGFDRNEVPKGIVRLQVNL